MITLEKCQRILSKKLSDYRALQKLIKMEEREIEEAVLREEQLLQSRNILQEVAKSIQNEAHKNISSIVTKCLSSVFDEPYKFEIVFTKARGRTEVAFRFIRDEIALSPEEVGGGVIDVASFALRVACILLCRPKPRRLIVLDEPFRFVSIKYRPACATLLETLSKDLQIQFVVVTHFEELKIGKVIEL